MKPRIVANKKAPVAWGFFVCQILDCYQQTVAFASTREAGQGAPQWSLQGQRRGAWLCGQQSRKGKGKVAHVINCLLLFVCA